MDAILRSIHKAILDRENSVLKQNALKHAGKLMVALLSTCIEEATAISTLKIIHVDQTLNKINTIWTLVMQPHLLHL